METRGRATEEQIATLLEFMESHSDLAKPQPDAQGSTKAEILWKDLTKLLNSVGGGVTQPAEMWKEVWADWKTETKNKALARSHGPSNRLTLSSLEKRV